MKAKHQDRAYQQEIEDAVFDYLFEEPGNPLVAAPGGTGKSFCMAKLVKRFLTDYPGTRIVVLAMDAKLLNQNCNELIRYWPEAPAGIYSSGLKVRDTEHPVIFAGIQSCAKRADEFGIRNIIIVDEADQISHKEETLYQKFIFDVKQMNPQARVIGFTATPYRLGIGCLTNMDMWDKIVIDLTKTERFNWFVEHGYLAPLVTKRPSVEIDVKSIAMKGNDFDEKSMQEVTDTDELNPAVVADCIKRGGDRNHWLVFSTGIKHSLNLTKLFNSRGVTTEQLSGKDTVEHRTDIEKKWKSGEIRCLVNCGLYGRGFDFPALDLIAIVRATQSVAWWIQACVRGTRTAEGKVDCLVLDYGGNIRRLGAVNNPIVPAPRRKGQDVVGEAPIKECPNCHSYVPIQCKQCPDCDFIFPPPKTINKTASDADIMDSTKKDAPVIEEYSVIGIRYTAKLSKNNLYFLEVKYFTGAATFKEACFFDTPNALTNKRLISWWQHRGGSLPIPSGTDEACERAQNELRIPALIRVDLNSKWKNVVGVDFKEKDDEDPF